MAHTDQADSSEQLRRITELLRKNRVSLTSGRDEEELPRELRDALRESLAVLIAGGVPTVVSKDRELSTQDAAALLNVSRQYVVRLVEKGTLPAAETEGGHRRLRLEDVLAYRKVRDAERASALDELENLTEEYGGYAKLKR
ncbi:MAG: helix-turn-helix domain-containing protein [Archangium sp.]